MSKESYHNPFEDMCYGARNLGIAFAVAASSIFVFTRPAVQDAFSDAKDKVVSLKQQCLSEISRKMP